MSGQQHPDNPHLVTMAANTAGMIHLLRSLLAQSRYSEIDIAVGNEHQQAIVLDNFPNVGGKRMIVDRPGAGSGLSPVAVPTGGVQILDANVRRLGLAIENSGDAPIILVGVAVGVTPPTGAQLGILTTGRPAWYLAAGAGAWDGRSGNTLWCGSVSAFGVGGASELIWAEY